MLVKLKHKNKLKKNVPGWNDYVKDLYHKARDKFLIWKNKGKPKNNKIHDDMKTSRKSFKNAFNHCKANENKIRDEKLVTCYKNKNSKDFWKEVRKRKKTDMKNSCVIEKERNPKLISENFSIFYKNIFDDDSVTGSVVSPKNIPTNNKSINYISHVTVYNTKSAISKLNSYIDIDNINTNHVKYATEEFHY